MEKIKPCESFEPAQLLANRHIQTIYPVFFRHHKPYSGITERCETPDGDFLDLVLSNNFYRKESQNFPIIFLLHGLGGDIRSQYASAMMDLMERKNYRGVFIHYRGCSGEANRKPISYNGAFIQDFEFVIKTFHKKNKSAITFAVGYSIGGSILLNYLIHRPQNSLRATVGISVPYNLSSASRSIGKAFFGVYEKHLLRSLKKSTKRKMDAGILPDKPSLASIHTLWDFDDAFTAPIHGYRDAADYYEKASSGSHLHSIKTPLLLIHARDDPFMLPTDAPAPESLHGNTLTMISPRGGHVGFVGKKANGSRFWMEECIFDYFQNFY